MSCDGKHATFWIWLIASCGYLTCYPVLSISCRLEVRSKGWLDSGLVLGGGVQCTVSPLIISSRPAFSVAKIGGWVQMAKVWRLHGESPPVLHPVVPPMAFLYIWRFNQLLSLLLFFAQIVPSLVSRSLFNLALESFWHDFCHLCWFQTGCPGLIL